MATAIRKKFRALSSDAYSQMSKNKRGSSIDNFAKLHNNNPYLTDSAVVKKKVRGVASNWNPEMEFKTRKINETKQKQLERYAKIKKEKKKLDSSFVNEGERLTNSQFKRKEFQTLFFHLKSMNFHLLTIWLKLRIFLN